MLIIWPSLWIAAMLGFIIATIVAALREKKSRVKSAQAYAPGAAMGATADPAFNNASAGFDDMMPQDAGFGDPNAEFAALDDNAFK